MTASSLNKDVWNHICTYLDPPHYYNLMLVNRTIRKLILPSLLYQQALYGWRHHRSAMRYAIFIGSSELLKYAAGNEDILQHICFILCTSMDYFGMLPIALEFYLQKYSLDNLIQKLTDSRVYSYSQYCDCMERLLVYGHFELFEKLRAQKEFVTDHVTCSKILQFAVRKENLSRLKTLVNYIGVDKIKSAVYQLFEIGVFAPAKNNRLEAYLLSLIDIDTSKKYTSYLLSPYIQCDLNILHDCIIKEYKLLDSVNKPEYIKGLAVALDRNRNTTLTKRLVNSGVGILDTSFLIRFDLVFLYSTFFPIHLKLDVMNEVLENNANHIFEYLLENGVKLTSEQEQRLISSNNFNLINVFQQYFRFTIDLNDPELASWLEVKTKWKLFYVFKYKINFTISDMLGMDITVLNFLASSKYMCAPPQEYIVKSNTISLEHLMEMAQIGVRIRFDPVCSNTFEFKNYRESRFVQNHS